MKKIFFVVSASVLLFLSACGGNPNGGLYLSGLTINSDETKLNAFYWKDDVSTSLLPVDKASAGSIFVTDDNVYTSGLNFENSNITACYWVGTTMVNLITDGNAAAYTTDIYVDGEDVYVSGLYEGSTDTAACYWKNGSFVSLEDTTEDAFALSITVYDGKAYVAGFVNGVAVYWVDGVKHEIDTGDAIATDIQVVDGDVYVAGSLDGKAVYWKNDVVTELTDSSTGGIATSIQVVDGDVYVAGQYGDDFENIAYWKNNAAGKVDLVIPAAYEATSPENFIMTGGMPDVVVDGDTVYISATVIKNPSDPEFVGILWTNGVAVVKEGYIYSSLFVK